MNWTGRCKTMLLAGMAAVLLVSCAAVEEAPDQYEMRNHPLAGRIWDVAASQFITPAELMTRAGAAKFVLLGEIHDNLLHHRIQATVLQSIAKEARPALVMEQFDRIQQDKINGVLQGASRTEQMTSLSELMRKTWGWPAYAPMVDLALHRQLPILAANLSRDKLRTVARTGFDALGYGEEQRLALETVWSAERQNQLMKNIHDGHCGKVSEHMVAAIAKSQRARDAVMADIMLQSQSGAIAIVGSGHARRDMAIPLYLAARAPQATVLSLGIVEVTQPTHPAAYARGPLGPLFDYIWFTPRVVRLSNACDSIPQSAPTPSLEKK